MGKADGGVALEAKRFFMKNPASQRRTNNLLADEAKDVHTKSKSV